MRRRFVALSTALATLPLAVVTGTASPAVAAPGANCGDYPAGLAYQIRVSPAGRTVDPGSKVVLSARVLRNGEVCSGREVRFYTHGPREFKIVNGRRLPAYHLSGTDVTDGTGLASITVTSINDFRFFGSYNADNSINNATSGPSGARTSGINLVNQTR